MEEGKGRRRFYGVSAKVAVMVLLLVGVILFATSGSIFVKLMHVGQRDPLEGQPPEEYSATAGCGYQMQDEMAGLAACLNDRKYFDVEGTYVPDRLVDITKDYSEGNQGIEEDQNTSYALDDLYLLDNQGIPGQLADYAFASLELSGNQEVRVEKEQESGSGSDSQPSAGATTEESFSVSEMNAAELTESETMKEIALEYMTEETWHHLQSVGAGKTYSRQFLYLYGVGYDLEKGSGIRTAAGSTLADYAARNSDTVSLYDLYYQMLNQASCVSSYLWAVDAAERYQEGSSNLHYYIQAEDRVYTNVSDWEDLGEKAVEEEARKGAMYLTLRRQEGKQAEAHYPENEAGSLLYQYLSSQTLLSENETLVLKLDTTYPVGDSYQTAARFYDKVAPYAGGIAAAAILGFFLALVCFILATLQSGRRAEDREVHLYAFDRLPTELAAALGILLGLFFVLSLGVKFVCNLESMSGTGRVLLALHAGGSTELFLIFYLSLVRRIKAGNLWQKSLLRTVLHLGSRAYAARKESTRLVLAGLALMLLHFLLLPAYGDSLFCLLICLLVDLLVLLYMIREAAGKQTVIEGMRQLGRGNLDYKVDTADLGSTNRELAEVVNAMGDGLQLAVEARMKNERMQADLITNVSHDIKTPLTSIVNYVDLLKREKIDNPRVQGYLEVLEQKSQRLKQLTEDLVEASKVSSGNVHMEFVILNLCELIQQVNGEFNERLEARDLELICSLPKEPVSVRADSRYLWRVMENLYSNAAKYAMPGSRIYVEIAQREGTMQFLMKNMSEQPLNIRADELMERFVRGDSSRTTEGSGLGLSIARNLVRLMQGSFDIFVDGDLFKVQITFSGADHLTKQDPSRQSD